MKGWIALDIDGTITQDKYSIPNDAVAAFREYVKLGWRIVFATGRVFRFAHLALDALDFPYFLLTQNGSLCLQMPEREPLFQAYIPSSKLAFIEKAHEGMCLNYLVYAGIEHEDQAYYCPERLSKEGLSYVKKVEMREKGAWHAVDSFNIPFDVPLVKCFGPFHEMVKLAGKLKATRQFQLTLIHDRFYPDFHVLLITDLKASKGLGLKKIFQLQGKDGLSIGGGDDENDISLLQASDVRIAMPHAPEKLRKIADFIAPPVEEGGIIQALKIVIDNATAKGELKRGPSS